MSIYDKERALPNDRALLQRFMVYARVRPAGLEPAALCSGGIRSNPTELRAHINKYYPNFSAASIVFSTSIAIVIGPTPPGTGVIADTLSIIESQSASPTIS